MSTKETIHSNKEQVSCSGKEYPFDHPVVYLEIDKEKGQIECPYCSKHFVLKKTKA